MAAKILQSLTDDNHDLQKQIGCMTGIFQIFDRQHVITPRRINGHRLKRHPNDSADETESNSMYKKSVPMEKHSRRNVSEKQRVSMESSRASLSSSSRSSSFSSLDLNKNAQQDSSSSSLDRITFPENPPKHAGMNQSSMSPKLGRKSFDLREVVKESMYRESQTLSIKTTSMEDVVKKSFTTPWLVDDSRELSRSASYHVKEGSFFSIAKEGPRFSYDGKDTRHLLYESRDNSKSSMKPPRLSIDSKESSSRSLKSETSSIQTRPSSVVAKLMGLEAMPSNSTKTNPVQDFNGVYRSTNTIEPSKPIQISIPYKEPNSPRWKVPDSTVKHISRLPIEPAPWKQVDRNRITPKAAIKNGMKAPLRNSNSRTSTSTSMSTSTFPTVFSEIEKRLKDLEFSQSGKDLRALKQILEAMQAKGLLENSNEENPRKSTNSTPLYGSKKPQNDQIVLMKPAKTIGKSGIPSSSVISLNELSNISRIHRGAFVDNRNFRGQIAKSSNRDDVSTDVKSNNKTSRIMQTSSSRSLHNEKERISNSSSSSISPRLHKKKQELEKRSKPPVHPTDPGRPRKPSNKQVIESSSPSVRRRPKTISGILQQNDEQSSDLSAQSNGSILSESHMDIEVNSSVSFKPEKKSTLLRREDHLQVDHTPVAPEYPSPNSVLDAVLDIDDSPSPVKHKQKTTKGDKSHEYESISSSDQCNRESGSIIDETGSIRTYEINRKKLQKIENLVQKLQRLNSSHDEAQTDYIASLCDNTNPDHRYISEILLASGFLLSDLESSLTNFNFHQSGHPINPELFLVLEQTKANIFIKDELDIDNNVESRSNQKFHRKLVFDTVNEVLARKLSESGLSSQPLMIFNKLGRKNLNPQKLLRELCLEMDEVQTVNSKCSSREDEEDDDDVLRNTLYEDVMHHSESWMNYGNDVSGIVLDIERLVFKDLVNDIVLGEAHGLENKPVRRRKLFKN